MTKIYTVILIIFLSVISLRPSLVKAAYIVDASSRGWYSSDGIHHDWNGNTLTGAVPDYYWSGQPFYAESHSFFVFDLSSIQGTITNAILSLEVTAYNSLDEYEAFTIYDVSTPINDLLEDRPPCGSYPPPPDSNYGQVIFNDLGSGLTYGNSVISSSDVGTMISINLSPNALNDINTQSIFAIGIALDDIGSTSNDEYIRFSETEEPRVHQLQLTIVPEPTSMLLLCFGLFVLYGSRGKLRQ